MDDVKNPEQLAIREAGAADAPEIAALHADSWRRHYRCAYADAYLDQEADEERASVWKTRLGAEGSGDTVTVVAELGGSLVGFAHVILDADPLFGALVENLHVTGAEQRRGVGSRLLAEAALVATTRRPGCAMYLWVLEQNTAARAFYEAMGGEVVERRAAGAPGGDPSRLVGSPSVLRMAWPDPGKGELAGRIERA